jgi:uncharacterized protein (DUF1697 family)
MSLVVFLRGVNVGGHKAFQPSVLARKLGGLDVKSFGAAGTFVVRGKVGERAARAEFLKHLPFDAHVMICTAPELVDLVGGDPFDDRALDQDIKRFISVLERRPRVMPRVPIHAPEGKDWQVAVIAVRGPFAMSLLRRIGRTLVYPNEVIEKEFGVAATTRSWSTILKVREALDPD